MKKKLSIHDIARELKVSATTISFVLDDSTSSRKVRPVRKKILDHVESTVFKPNLIDQALRTGNSKIIGMLVEDISDPFFSSIGRMVEDNLYKLGYKIFHSSTDNNTARSKDLLQMFRNRHVDGYIIAPSPEIEGDIQCLFATNYLAVSGLKAISGLDLKIPEDIGVTGFDDNTHFALFSPSITAIAQLIQEISEEVVKQLIAALDNVEGSKKRRTVVLPVKLIVRNSSVASTKKKICSQQYYCMKKHP